MSTPEQNASNLPYAKWQPRVDEIVGQFDHAQFDAMEQEIETYLADARQSGADEARVAFNCLEAARRLRFLFFFMLDSQIPLKAPDVEAICLRCLRAAERALGPFDEFVTKLRHRLAWSRQRQGDRDGVIAVWDAALAAARATPEQGRSPSWRYCEALALVNADSRWPWVCDHLQPLLENLRGRNLRLANANAHVAVPDIRFRDEKLNMRGLGEQVKLPDCVAYFEEEFWEHPHAQYPGKLRGYRCSVHGDAIAAEEPA